MTPTIAAVMALPDETRPGDDVARAEEPPSQRSARIPCVAPGGYAVAPACNDAHVSDALPGSAASPEAGPGDAPSRDPCSHGSPSCGRSSDRDSSRDDTSAGALPDDASSMVNAGSPDDPPPDGVRRSGAPSGSPASGGAPSDSPASGDAPSGSLEFSGAQSGVLPSGGLESSDEPSGRLESGGVPSGSPASSGAPSGSPASGGAPSDSPASEDVVSDDLTSDDPSAGGAPSDHPSAGGAPSDDPTLSGGPPADDPPSSDDELTAGPASLQASIRVADERWAELAPTELAEMVLAALAGSSASPNCVATCDMLFTDDAEMRDLNGRFRHLDRATNVLAFPSGEPCDRGIPAFLGGIALSIDRVGEEARERGIPATAHVTHLTLHGMLHLLGYDHEDDAGRQKMERIEVDILDGLGIKNPYEGS